MTDAKSGCSAHNLRMLLLLAVCLIARAQEAPLRTGQAKNLSSLELEQLLNLNVTTASKLPERQSDAAGMISVVSKDELRRFGGTTLREILERVPGLTGTTSSFTDRSMVAARGDQTRITGGHILILINGRPTREVLQGGIISDLLESFPVAILERIEVIRGPGSVLYGSNAFSAVINLITQKADGTGITIAGAAGAGGAMATSAQAMFERGDLNMVAAAQFRQNAAWTVPYQSQDPFSGTSSTVDLPLADRGPGAYLGMNYKGLTLMSAFTQWESSVFAIGLAGQTRWRRGFTDLGYTFQPRERWSVSLNLGYTRTTLDAASFQPASITRDSSEVVLEWTNFITLSEKDRLTLGSLYNHIQGQELFTGVTPALAIAEGSRNAGAIYAQLDHRLTGNVKLVGGFQVNKIGNLAVDIVPRAGVVWNPAPRFDVKALFSQAYRAPSIGELYVDHPGLKGNPDLKPEHVATSEMGVS